MARFDQLLPALVQAFRLAAPGAGLAEARWALATGKRPPRIEGLPSEAQEALQRAREHWAAIALTQADEALWRAAERCQPGWAEHVSAARLARVLTAEEWESVAVVEARRRTLRTAWREARWRRAAERPRAGSGPR